MFNPQTFFLVELWPRLVPFGAAWLVVPRGRIALLRLRQTSRARLHLYVDNLRLRLQVLRDALVRRLLADLEAYSRKSRSARYSGESRHA